MNNVKKSLSSILRGYSYADWRGSPVFIKHFSYIESADTDRVYENSFNRCIKLGILTEEQKLQFLAEKKLWTDKDEKKLLELKGKFKDVHKKKSKAILPSQVKLLSDELDVISIELNNHDNQRLNLIGTTAELIASQKSDDYFLIRSFYKDKKFEQPLFSDSEFYEMDYLDLSEIKSVYSKAVSDLKGNEVKKIALSGCFLELSFLTENMFEILNKPIAEYTFFQMDLISYAKIYKRILSHNPGPPDYAREDPEKLEAWYDSITRKEKVVSKIGDKEVGGSTIVGATSSDIKEIFGEESGVINLSEEIAKNGEKRMSMKDLIKLHM
jgi:hypothetical protein